MSFAVKYSLKMIPNIFKTNLSKTSGEQNLGQGNFMVLKREKIARHVL